MSVATVATQLYQLGKLSFHLKHYHIECGHVVFAY